MMKVKIVKDTWGHSKKCWYMVAVDTVLGSGANGMTLNYYGFTSKKAATKRALELDCEVVE